MQLELRNPPVCAALTDSVLLLSEDYLTQAFRAETAALSTNCGHDNNSKTRLLQDFSVPNDFSSEPAVKLTHRSVPQSMSAGEKASFLLIQGQRETKQPGGVDRRRGRESPLHLQRQIPQKL